jgi:hypothetical protein
MRLWFVIALVACNYAPPHMAAFSGDATNSTDGRLDDSSPPDGPPPDMTTLPACPPAPSGCELFECAESTSCYYKCPARSWTGARDQCVTDQRGCLATINSASEDVCLFANVGPLVFPDLAWFGYRQASNQATPIAGWDWECGNSTYLAPNWGAFEPNDGNNSENNAENCAAIGADGAWIDIGCSDQKRYVCELPR